MKKIPTLFTRVFENRRIVKVLPEITPGYEEAFLRGSATVQFDGSCCAVIDGEFYRRYDAKKGKKPPKGAIPCCDPDPVTGHWPHWVKISPDNPSDKWFVEAARNYMVAEGVSEIEHGTYEAIGPHFNGNPHNLMNDILVKHGCVAVSPARDFDSIKNYLQDNPIEGLVFWLDGEPVCKIKRSDFGFKWPMRGE
jgi:hypothetical protein